MSQALFPLAGKEEPEERRQRAGVRETERVLDLHV
jgi:hypothetical protein